MTTIIDLASVRSHRQRLADQVSVASTSYVGKLETIGQNSAKLAWHLAAPVRSCDDELTQGIYKLVLNRLREAVESSVRLLSKDLTRLAKLNAQAWTIASAAFVDKLVSLYASSKDVQSVSS